MEKHSDLNSLLVEGVITQLNEKDFVIQSFRYLEDEDGLTTKVENRFQVMTVHGRKYPIKKGMKIRVVGRLQYQDGDERTSIIPEYIEMNREQELPYNVANVMSIVGG